MTTADLRNLANAMPEKRRAAVLAQLAPKAAPDAPTATKARRGMNKTEAAFAIGFRFSLRTVNPLNGRQHWRSVSERGKREKQITATALYRADLPSLPATVRLTRIGKRRMDDDGLAASFKHVRDEIARAYGIDDGDARFIWKYAQEIGGEYAVRVEIRSEGVILSKAETGCNPLRPLTLTEHTRHG